MLARPAAALIVLLVVITAVACATETVPDPATAAISRDIATIQSAIQELQIQIDELADATEQLQASLRQTESATGTPTDSMTGAADAYDIPAVEQRIRELQAGDLRFTQNTATADQKTIVTATADCIANQNPGTPPELIADLSWAEAGATRTDRQLAQDSIDQCAGAYIMSRMMNAFAMLATVESPDLTEAEAAQMMTAPELPTDHPDVVKLAGCAPVTQSPAEAREMAATYLSILPEAARAAAARLYCGY